MATSTAQARTDRAQRFSVTTLSDVRVGTSKQELRAQIDHSARVLQFFMGHKWMRAVRHSSCINIPWRTTCVIARNKVRAHSWLKTLAADRLDRLYPPPPIYSVGSVSAWECIHAGEGAWNSNTGNGYYGGLQMDYTFMSTYGRELLAAKGTANNWTPAEQMMVAQKAHDSGRGYYPWPNTARRCGLL